MYAVGSQVKAKQTVDTFSPQNDGLPPGQVSGLGKRCNRANLTTAQRYDQTGGPGQGAFLQLRINPAFEAVG